MKVLHLVLYSKGKVYDDMVNVTQPLYAHLRKVFDIQTYYYHYDESLSEPQLDGMFLSLPGKETYIPGILEKTIAALDWFFQRRADDCKFDFVVRSNISSVINFQSLMKCLEFKVKAIFYAGTSVITSDFIHPLHGKVAERLLPLSFAHGTCLVMSSKAVFELLGNLHLVNRITIDDVSLGAFFKEIEKPIIDLGGEIDTFDNLANIDNVCTFRNHTYHTDRKQDLENMRFQVDSLMQRYTKFPKNVALKTVWYFDKDITSNLVFLCKILPEWTSTGNNVILDDLFGDPKPNQRKCLLLDFKDGQKYSQNATLTFYWKSNNLFVN